jgi:tetratricopeptide (TPR) repeat protein
MCGASERNACPDAHEVQQLGTMLRYRFCQVAVGALLSLFVSPLGWAADCGSTPYDCALQYLSRHNPSAAIHSINEVLQQDPQNLKALNLLGIALTESGHIDEANTSFRRALEIDAGFIPARKNLAVNEFDQRRLPESASDLTLVLKSSPADPIAHIYLGEIDFQNKNFALALPHYEKAGARVASNALWTLHYAHCLAAKGRVDQAARVLRALPPDDGDDRFQGGLILGQAGAYSAAAALFASARKTYRDPYVAGYNELLMLIRAENYAEAIQLFNQLVSEGDSRAELYNLASEAYRKSGDIKNAYDSLRAATRLEPTTEENYLDLAALCLDEESYDVGLEVLDVGLHYVPNSYRLYVQRGFMLVMRGRMEEAEKEFQTASSLAPDKSLPYIALGEVWMQAGQAQRAADMLRPKIAAPGTDFLTPYVFAEALIRSGAETGTPAEADAIRALEKSIQLNPKYSHSHAELGKLLFKQGEVDRAIPELKTAAELDPNDSGPFFWLGQAYRKKGEKAKADEMLARVAQLHTPEHEMDMNKELRRLVKQETASAQSEARP